MPTRSVTTFHAMAANSEAYTTDSVTASSATTSCPIVVATAAEISGPTPLAIAANHNARRGLRARVEMTVATTFDESCNPLKKPKASAIVTNTNAFNDISCGILP